jgi:hypothetical protein
MRISFKRTFAQFSDNYLATHYSGGVKTISRLVGGPIIIVGAVLLAVTTNSRLQASFLRLPFLVLAFTTLIYGLLRTLQPLINLFLVWLRRDQLFSDEQSAISLQLKGDKLIIEENDEKIDFPIEQIKSIQHRAESTWILTEGDYLISIPRAGLSEGNHDKFFTALEDIFYVDEE